MVDHLNELDLHEHIDLKFEIDEGEEGWVKTG
jgi:hypothetical protein